MLFLAAMGLTIAGIIAMCIGVLFVAPYLSLMWCVAYLRMTGQMWLFNQVITHWALQGSSLTSLFSKCAIGSAYRRVGVGSRLGMR